MKCRFLLILLIALLPRITVKAQLFDEAFSYSYPQRMLVLDSISTFILKPYRTDSLSYFTAVEQIITKATRLNDKKSLLYAEYLTFYFNIYNFKWNEKKVNEVYQDILSRAKRLNAYTVQVNLYLNMGYYYSGKKNPNYLLYFDYLNKAYLLYMDMDVKGCTDKAYNLYSLALSYYKFGDYIAAIKYAEIVNSLPKVPYINMFNYNLIGVCYLKISRYDSARVNFERTYQLAEGFRSKDEFTGWDGIALGNIGNSWYLQKNYEKAIDYYLKAIPICEKAGLWDNVSPFTSRLITSYLKTGSITKAETYIPLAREAISIYKDVECYHDFYMAMGDFYKAKGDGMQAVIFRDSALYFSDSLQKIFDRNLKVQIQLGNYNDKVANQQALYKSEKARERVIRAAIFLVILSVLAAVAIFINRQRKILNNKNYLLKEIHHRVKNNLQLIGSILDIQQRTLKDESLINAFADAKSRINSMALVHQNLYEKENVGDTDTEEYFNQLFRIISVSYSPKNTLITHSLKAKGKVNLDTLVPIALIFNELLTNTYKYAFVDRDKGHINFTLSQNGDNVEMTYSDNGKGFEPGFEWNRSRGLGSLMIRKFTQQLQGHYKIETHELGVKFIFNFKAAK